jgi:hypothetical protein
MTSLYTEDKGAWAPFPVGTDPLSVGTDPLPVGTDPSDWERGTNCAYHKKQVGILRDEIGRLTRQLATMKTQGDLVLKGILLAQEQEILSLELLIKWAKGMNRFPADREPCLGARISFQKSIDQVLLKIACVKEEQQQFLEEPFHLARLSADQVDQINHLNASQLNLKESILEMIQSLFREEQKVVPSSTTSHPESAIQKIKTDLSYLLADRINLLEKMIQILDAAGLFTAAPDPLPDVPDPLSGVRLFQKKEKLRLLCAMLKSPQPGPDQKEHALECEYQAAMKQFKSVQQEITDTNYPTRRPDLQTLDESQNAARLASLKQEERLLCEKTNRAMSSLLPIRHKRWVETAQARARAYEAAIALTEEFGKPVSVVPPVISTQVVSQKGAWGPEMITVFVHMPYAEVCELRMRAKSFGSVLFPYLKACPGGYVCCIEDEATHHCYIRNYFTL